MIWINIIGFILILLIIIWLLTTLIKRFRKKDKKILEIPEEILEDFQEAERRYEEDIKNGKKTNPHSILWEISKEKSGYRRNQQTTTREQTTSNRELSTRPSGRQDIQNGTATNSIKDDNSYRKPKRKNRRIFLRRRRN